MADTNLLVLAREFKKLRAYVKEVLQMSEGPQGLQGEKGEKGDKGDKGLAGNDGKDGKDGKDGLNGFNGTNGKDGLDGKDGVSVTDAYIDFDGSLVFKLSNGNEINAGDISSEQAANVYARLKNGAYSLNELLPSQTGQTGKVLSTDGVNTSWVAPSSLLAENTTIFTTGSGTYTAPANTQWVKVTVVGPGGNGGAALSQRATGGGGGAVAIKWLQMNAGQSLSYAVGASSPTPSTVTSGSLGITTISAGSGANGAGTAYALSQTAGATGGTATGGAINLAGGTGGYSYGSSTTVSTNFSGKGGDCPGFGIGGPALAMVATAGVQGTGYGAGGGGAHGNATSASGRSGIIIFEAF